MTRLLRHWVAGVALLVAVTGGCTSGDADPADTPLVASTRPSPEFVAAAETICLRAKDDLAALGANVTSGGPGENSDPLLDSLIRPGTSIYVRQAAELRTLAERLDAPDAVQAYLGYFEIIDALLTARLDVGRPGGPQVSDARSLEARFQAMATEQAEAAREAGLAACAYDATEIIFGQ